jgi:hypothetical protein
MSRIFLLPIAAVVACAHTPSDPNQNQDRFPIPTAFGYDEFATPADCASAKQAGTFSPMATCQDQLLLCPDGSSAWYRADVIGCGNYTFTGGTITMTERTEPASPQTWTVAADGTVTQSGRVWVPIDPAGAAMASCPVTI